MRLARTAKGVLRSALKALTDSCSFFSISASESGWNVLTTSPVAGLIVAMAMMTVPSSESDAVYPHRLHFAQIWILILFRCKIAIESLKRSYHYTIGMTKIGAWIEKFTDPGQAPSEWMWTGSRRLHRM